MAITVTDLGVRIADTVGRTTYTSGNFTPTNNKLYLVVCEFTPETASGGVLSGVTTTTGLTFVQVAQRNFATGSNLLAVFRGLASAGLGIGTYSIVMVSGNRTACVAYIVEVDGIDTSGTNGSGAITNVVSAAAATANPSVTLAAFSNASNGTFGAFGFSDQNAPTAGGAFTATGTDPDIGSPSQGAFGEYATSNQTTVDCTHIAANWGGIAFELIAAAAATGQPTMRRWGGVPHMGGRKRFGGGSGGGAWGRDRSGLWVPNHDRKAA